MDTEKTPSKSVGRGQFTVLYFAAASSFTKLTSETLSAPLPLQKLFDVLEGKYPGMREKVLNSCAVTINLEYVDMDEEGDTPATKKEDQTIIQIGDEVAIIPPHQVVSSHGGVSSSARRWTLFTDRSPKAPITVTKLPGVEDEMDIDPRLRGMGDGGNPSYNQQPKRSSYPNPLAPAAPPSQQQNSDSPNLPSLTSGQYYPSFPTTPQSAYQNPSTHASADSGGPQYDSPDQGSEDHAPSHSAQYNAEAGNESGTARSRACEACRSLKVRCEPDPANPDGSCKRCTKAGRNCIITVPNRKRQKKTDSRVAELEKKIDALTASLHATRGQDSSESSAPKVEQPPSASAYPPPPPPPSADSLRGGWMGQVPAGQDGVLRQSVRGIPTPPAATVPKRKRSDDIGGYVYTLQSGSLAANPDGIPDSYRQKSSTPATRDSAINFVDVIDRQIMDLDTAQQMFYRYVTKMAPIMPVVVFPPGTSALDVRRKKPILFLAILSVGSGRIRPDLQQMLTEETHRIFAERIIIKGEKSLELIQALLVSTLWYQPPEQYEELKFYQLIHIAATMAIDVGMGKRSKPAEKRFMGIWKDNPWKKSNVPDPDAAETRRTWLGCYFLCANAAMALRRPIMVRWQPYMDECIEMLEGSPDTYPSDQALCQWIKLQRIAEDVAFQFSMDDPTGLVGVTDAKTQYALKGFKGQLDAWRRDVTQDQYTPALMLSDHVVNLFVHEVAMHTDQNGDDFKPPYTDPNLTEAMQLDITPAQVGALTNCLTSIHNIFDTFLSFDTELIRALPTIHLVRTTYSGVALIKLYSSVTVPGTKLEKVFNPEDLKVEHYLDSILACLGRAAEGDYSKPAAKFLQILGMLKSWYQKRKEGLGKAGKEVSPYGPGGQGALPPLSASDGSSSHWSVRTPPDAGRKQDNARNTPLHLLSAVAMNDSSTGGNVEAGVVDNGSMYRTPQSFGAEGNMIEQMGFGGGDLDQAMGLGFGADDISALFMDDPFWNLASVPDGSSADYLSFK